MITKFRELLAYRGFAPLALSRFISNVGNGVAPIALAYGVLSIPGAGAGSLSLVMSARMFPMIGFMLFGGVIGALSFIFNKPSILLLMCTGGLFGILAAIWYPSMQGILPGILPKEKLQYGNAVVGLLSNMGYVIGALIGGTIVTLFGSGWGLFADGVTFLIAGLLVWNLHFIVAEKMEKKSVFQDLRLGWREVRQHNWVLVMIAAFALINTSYETMIQIFGPLAFDKDGMGPKFWSYNLAGLTIGMIIGGALALRFTFSRPLFFAMSILALSALWDFSIAAHLPIYWNVLGAVISGMTIEIFMVAWNTSLQTHIPEESFSRVAAYDTFGSFGLSPIGIALAGPFVAIVGLSNALWITGGVTALASIASLTSRSVRNIRIVTH